MQYFTIYINIQASFVLNLISIRFHPGESSRYIDRRLVAALAAQDLGHQNAHRLFEVVKSGPSPVRWEKLYTAGFEAGGISHQQRPQMTQKIELKNNKAGKRDHSNNKAPHKPHQDSPCDGEVKSR